MTINSFFDPLIFDAPWMIEPTAMENLVSALRRMDGEEAMRIVGREPEEDTPGYELRGDMAVIRISGTLTRQEGFFSRLFGGNAIRTYGGIMAAAAEADADPRVRKKLLVFDSPGGTVAGAFEAAHFLAKSGKNKPVYAYADGQMTSAAQLLGATAKKVGAPKTAQVGSIGVIWAHINEQGLNEQIGIEVTYLTAGKYKKLGNPDEPLSSEAKAYFQDRLDRTYSFFVDDVAAYRNMAAEDVLSAADGKVFLAEQGREAGLVDVIVNDFEEFLATLTKEDTTMDLNELKTQHPDLYAQVLDQGKKEGKEAARAEAPDPKAAAGEAAERVLSIVRVVEGDETADQIKQISDLDMTAEQLKAVKGLFVKPADSEKSGDGGGEAASPSRKQILEGLQASGQQPLNAGNGDGKGGQDVDFMAEVEAYKKDNPNASHFAAIQAVRKIHPQAYEKWMEAENRKK